VILPSRRLTRPANPTKHQLKREAFGVTTKPGESIQVNILNQTCTARFASKAYYIRALRGFPKGSEREIGSAGSTYPETDRLEVHLEQQCYCL
jgi:hypothetical protein